MYKTKTDLVCDIFVTTRSEIYPTGPRWIALICLLTHCLIQNCRFLKLMSPSIVETAGTFHIYITYCLFPWLCWTDTLYTKYTLILCMVSYINEYSLLYFVVCPFLSHLRSYYILVIDPLLLIWSAFFLLLYFTDFWTFKLPFWNKIKSTLNPSQHIYLRGRV
jgi:hypothetical protein